MTLNGLHLRQVYIIEGLIVFVALYFLCRSCSKSLLLPPFLGDRLLRHTEKLDVITFLPADIKGADFVRNCYVRN